MKKEYRVKRNEDIEAIIKNHKSYGNKFFNVYIKENHETNHVRYAISIGKKIGDAVTRNRRKRQIRSIIDNIITLEQPVDVFVVGKPTINNIDFLEMKNQLIYLFKKLNVNIKGEKD